MRKTFLLLVLITALFSCKKDVNDVNTPNDGSGSTPEIRWKKIASKFIQGTFPNNMEPASKGVKFLSMVGDSIYYYGYYTKVYATYNQGKNWYISDRQHNIKYIKAISKDTAFVCHTGGVDYTFNGGNTWIAVNADVAIIEPNSIVFKSSKVGFIAAQNGAFRTTDGGLSWQRRLVGNYCWFSFVENNVAYGVGQDSLVIKSIDGGVSWVTKPTYNGTTAINAAFIDENIGFINTGNALYVTRDAALTYTQSFFGQPVVDFKFISSTEGFLTTVDGVVYHTTDTGLKWVVDNDRLFIQYLATAKGKIYGSNDGIYKRF